MPAPAATPEAADRVARLMSTDRLDDDPSLAALTLYGDAAPDGTTANWNEPAAARASDLPELIAPDKIRDANIPAAEAAADMGRFREAAVSAGFGPTTAAAVFEYATKHASAQIAAGKPYEGTPETALKELRSHWGSKTGAKLAQVNTFIDTMEKHYPMTRAYIRGWNLDCDPRFIRMISARASRMSRSNG